MKIISLLAVLMLLCPAGGHSALDGVSRTAGSVALGGTGVAGGEDSAVMFINPAGLASRRSTAIYLGLSVPESGEGANQARFAAGFSRESISLGLGGYRRDRVDGRLEECYAFTMARRIAEGATGTFISVGAGLSYGRISRANQDDCCRLGRSSDSNVNLSVGIVIRFLPVISLGYSLNNLREVDFRLGGYSGEWDRINRWGLTYYWNNTVKLSYQRENGSGSASNHYGFSARTALPLRIMGGFSGDRVYGGLGWEFKDFRGIVSFSPVEDKRLETRISLEYLFGLMGEGVPE